MKIKITKVPSNRKDLGGILQASGSNWTPGNVSVINAGGTHSLNPNEGVLVGVDPENVPNLVEEGEVIFNDYVFSNRIECPKEVCRALRVGTKKGGYTFAEVAKKLLAESKERPNDPISKRGLAANMQKLEDYQEEVKQKMEAEKAVDQFNSLPPEQQVAIMNQEGQKALDAVAQEQMAQEFQSLPPEQQQAIAQQMMAEHAAAQGMPQGGSPEEQAMIQQQYAAQQDAAMQQAAAEQQYQQQRAAQQQQALAQAAAMQQQALNGAAYGGRLFAEGGMIPQEQPTEQATEQVDSEMAKYSDEELQEIINEYEEAANGEKKVTKGRLARLRKKAERAERELERRNSEGEGTEQEQSGSAEGQPQEPTQEQIQAAAQAQAQQQMMEGLPQEGISLEGMSPELAMMMQQLMGQQMSPEEMAMMQQLGQYGYGGNLYPTGGRLTGLQLLKLLGFNNYPDAAKAGFEDPSIFGLTDWNDELPSDFQFKNDWLDYKDISPELKYAIENKLYNPASLAITDENAPWFEPTAGTGLYNWTDFKGSGKGARKYDGSDIITDEDEFRALQAAYPHVLGNLTYSEGMTLGDILETMRAHPDWIKTQAYLRDKDSGEQRRAEYMAAIAPNNYDKDKKKFRDGFSATKIYDFRPDGKGGFTAKRKSDVSVKDELAFWDKVQSDYKFGDMYNTYHVPGDKTRYFVVDDKGNYKEYFDAPGNGFEQVGSDLSSYIYGDDETADNLKGTGYNQTLKFYKAKADATANENKKDGESKYWNTVYKPRSNWQDYIYGALPGLTGLGMMLAQGKPDMSGIEAAADFYANSGPATTVAPHLTHGLIQPAIIDPRNTHNTLNASRLATNRVLRNTGSAPSQAASILANDINYQNQMGQNDLRDWLANRQQEQSAAQFNRETATTNANILNNTDQFNAQMLANRAEKSAQLRYQAAKEKLDQENAYRAGLLGNIGSVFSGINEARKQKKLQDERGIMLASGVFGEVNPFIEEYYGLSRIDPNTGKVMRGYNAGMYWGLNPDTNKYEYSDKPFLATPSIQAACGGKLKKNKKRKGFTF